MDGAAIKSLRVDKKAFAEEVERRYREKLAF
jgi:hypothetical protein